MTEKMKMLESFIHDLAESVERYEQGNTLSKYDVERFDCKESIKRRIIVIREELLKVSKMMEGKI